MFFQGSCNEKFTLENIKKMFRQAMRPAAKTFLSQSKTFSVSANRCAVRAFAGTSGNDAGGSRFTSARNLFWLSLAIFATTSSAAYCQAESADHSKKDKSTFRVISRKEVETHNTLDKHVWVTYGEGVYDVTNFLKNHPGGREKLMSVAGKDIASMWNLYAHHKTSPLALELLSEMQIGVLSKGDVIVPPKNTHVATYSNKPVYDCIVVGSGMSGLQCGWSLVNEYDVPKDKVLVLEAQDYVGGRVKQMKEFIRGTKVEVGAEFLHGNGTELTKFARKYNQPLREIFCWAHGDCGPSLEDVKGGYGLYFVGKDDLDPKETSSSEVSLNKKNRLLRYDDNDADFVNINNLLWDLVLLDENKIDESVSLDDYLKEKKININMQRLAESGFSNTFCANSNELSLKQAVKWCKVWHNTDHLKGEPEGDYTFKYSYSGLVDHLKKDLQIELNTPVQHIEYPESGEGLVTVRTSEGVEYHCKNIVLTASPHVMNNKMIQFSPPLPDEIVDAFANVKMNSITKVILKFSKHAWPKDLHGMIMTDKSFLLPEVWFRIVEDEVEPDEPATAYAVGFTTSKYAERVSQFSQEEVFKQCLHQLDEIFSQLEPRHMSANPDDPQNVVALKNLPKPSEVYLGGMFWDWRPSHHPYIGGGYCSPLAGRPITIGEVLKKGNGEHMFFAGEASNHRPGATAHAAMETGLRAAEQVHKALQK